MNNFFVEKYENITIPVKAPLMVTSKLQVFPNICNLLMMSEPKAAKEADIIVLTTETATAAPSPSELIVSCDPPLKAKNPKNKMKPPRAAI